jgi:tRNA dimethylallyltransferase
VYNTQSPQNRSVLSDSLLFTTKTSTTRYFQWSVENDKSPWSKTKGDFFMVGCPPMDKTHIVCVAGPTASGKSARAVQIALERNGEIISVDSRQVYKTLNIGTEKTTQEEMQGIPHYLIDIREPNESYSAGDFVQDATRLIEDIAARGKLPILVGGTHFYFDALMHGLPETPLKDTELRDALELRTNESLFEEIERRDVRRSKELDPKNHRRLVRALELIETYGSVPIRSPQTSYLIEWELLLPERDTLRERISKRLQETLEKGLVEEVRRVRELVGDTRLNELGLEYRIVGEYLRGERSEDSLYSALKAKLFQYARRQEAWLRKLQQS